MTLNIYTYILIKNITKYKKKRGDLELGQNKKKYKKIIKIEKKIYKKKQKPKKCKIRL